MVEAAPAWPVMKKARANVLTAPIARHETALASDLRWDGEEGAEANKWRPPRFPPRACAVKLFFKAGLRLMGTRSTDVTVATLSEIQCEAIHNHRRLFLHRAASLEHVPGPWGGRCRPLPGPENHRLPARRRSTIGRAATLGSSSLRRRSWWTAGTSSSLPAETCFGRRYRALMLKAMGDMCRATRLAIMGAVVSRNFLKCAVARCASKAVASS